MKGTNNGLVAIALVAYFCATLTNAQLTDEEFGPDPYAETDLQLQKNESNSTTVATTLAPTDKNTTLAPTTVVPTTNPNMTTTAPAHVSPAEVPWAKIMAGGWIPFTVLCGVSVLFSFSYMQYYQHKREKECGSTMIATLAMSVGLLTVALVPVDIYLVSSLKKADGTFEDWATPGVIDEVKTIGQDAYYAMYALDMLFVFFLLPLSYFFFEEKDEEEKVGCGKRLLGAIKYTSVFVIIMAIFMCIGAFATSSASSDCDQQLNSTNAKDWAKCRGEFAEKALISDNGSNALSFTFGCLVVIGLIYFIFYTGVGMVVMPINMIRSRNRASEEERQTVKEQQSSNRNKKTNIRDKYKKKKGRVMSSRDHRQLIQAENDERAISKAETRVKDLESGILGKVSKVCRPFEFLFGFVFFILAVFLFIALTMTSADKLMQLIQSGDYKLGYAKATPRITNPVDWVFVMASKAFPIDYIFITLIVYFLVLATLNGVKALGVRFCYLKMYKFRAQRTVPQGLLFLAFILVFVILAINVVLLSLAPQYVTYGHQHYSPGLIGNIDANNQLECLGAVDYPSSSVVCNQDAPGYIWVVKDNDGTEQQVYYPKGLLDSKSVSECNAKWKQNLLADAPTYVCQKDGSAGNQTVANWISAQVSCTQIKDPCVQTRLAALLHTFFYNFWFLGAIYFWSNWGFILVFMLALIYYTCKKRKSLFQAMLNEVNDDMYDSDDDIAPFRPSWA
jgi:LMBR1 domain-containing protein 1